MILEWVSDGKKKIQLYDSGKVQRFEYEVTQIVHTRKGTTTIGAWHEVTDPPLEGTSREQWKKAEAWYRGKVQ